MGNVFLYLLLLHGLFGLRNLFQFITMQCSLVKGWQGLPNTLISSNRWVWLTHIDTYWHILTHIDTYWHILTHIDTYWHYIDTHWHYIDTCWRYLDTYWHILTCAPSALDLALLAAWRYLDTSKFAKNDSKLLRNHVKHTIIQRFISYLYNIIVILQNSHTFERSMSITHWNHIFSQLQS